MKNLTRITLDSKIMGGKPCVRGMRLVAGSQISERLPEAVSKLPVGICVDAFISTNQ